jgi:hypothetical protein
MRCGQHQHPSVAVLVEAQRRDDRAGAILLAFVAVFKMLAVPKVAVTDDETGDRLRQRHPRSLQLGVEVREFIRRLGVADGLDPFLGQLGREPHLAIAPLEPRPFLGRPHYEGVAPVLRDDDRLMPGLVAQLPKAC